MIENVKDKINKDEILEICRNKSKDFIRNRKITAKSIIYYELNKKGLSSKMEIDDFVELTNIPDVSSVAMLKQREKLNPEVFKYLNSSNIKIFYERNPNEVKTFKGYLLTAIDGSDFEIPNTSNTRKEYASYKSVCDNNVAARASISVQFDLLNNFVLDTIVNPYKTSELRSMEKNLENSKQLVGNFKILRIMDRGYTSLEDMYNSNINNDKFIVRLKNNLFKHERANSKNNDFVIKIVNQYDRTSHYKTSNPELYNYLINGGEIVVRIINVILPNGETEILATNIFSKEMKTSDFNYLYNLRWGIETNYHYLKESMKIENITSSKKT